MGGGQKTLYVEEVLPGARYTLRKVAKRGVDVLEDTEAKEDLSHEPYEQAYVQALPSEASDLICKSERFDRDGTRVV